jgi:hypothetical protein
VVVVVVVVVVISDVGHCVVKRKDAREELPPMMAVESELVEDCVAPSWLWLHGEEALKKDKVIELSEEVVRESVGLDDALVIADELSLTHLVLHVRAGKVCAQQNNGKAQDGDRF